MADERLGIALTLKNKAATQYMGMDFNSMCKFGDDYLGANDSGVFTVFSGATDNGTAITAYFTLPVSDLGIPANKRIIGGLVGGEVGGGMQVSVQFEGGTWQAFTMTPSLTGQLQQGQEFRGRYDMHGRYFAIKVSNVAGVDFSCDQIDLVVSRMSNKPSGS